MILKTISSSSEETEQLGEILGKRFKGGEIIELRSDLGGGKTTFVRGVVRGVGSKGHVSSPTFKVCNVYESNNLQVYHYDFYRLKDAGIMEYELSDALNDPHAVVIIEWGELMDRILPDDRLTIAISSLSDSHRSLLYSYTRHNEYLVA